MSNPTLINEINTSFPDNTGGLITPALLRQFLIDFVNVALYTNIADQVIISGGATVTSLGLGVISGGTVTMDCGARPNQYLTNNGAFTLAAPVNDGSCILLVTNGASAGIITFSGFSVGATAGDALDTVNGHKFSISIWRVNGISGYRVAAHQ